MSASLRLPDADQAELEQAVYLLRTPRLPIRLANLAAKPFDGAMKFLPKSETMLHRMVHRAMLGALDLAIQSRDGAEFTAPSQWRSKLLTGLTSGIGGLFGGFLLPVELPITVTLMLRGIADIAAHQGEDLSTLEARLACLQVFALSDRRRGAEAAMGYYTMRATLNRLSANVLTALIERGTIDASTPVVSRLIAEIVSRFGVVLSERAAAGAVPVLGMLTSSTLNVVFMDHFERIARAHFTIRRLERQYGAQRIGELFRLAASGPASRQAVV